jgi:GxxExxY protein
MGSRLRIDLLVENPVIVELKSVDPMAPLHQAQIISCLKLSGRALELLINFNVAPPLRRHQAICKWHWVEVKANNHQGHEGSR